MKPSFIFACASLPVICGTVHGATVTGSYTIAPNDASTPPHVMPSGPDTDWAYWTRGNGLTSGPLAATNSSFTGPRNFELSTLNGGSLRGPANTTTGAPVSFFTYDNGTSPTEPDAGTSTTYRPTGIFNSQLGPNGTGTSNPSGAGIQTTLSGFPSQSLISVWVYNFSAQGTFEVFINGTLSYTETVAIPSANPSDGKAAYLFSLNFTPDTTTDEVNIRYRMTDRLSTDANAHVGLQAITISPIPEPASLAMLLLGTGTLGFRRRRI
ncbi:PEP-CTERM sorting domain-containing protein [Luteolibacter sp. SL250]|uniref:PEP-CTERM sorting domain-containing protein n=1 Tax=Luteolibacter sp. SL250 TaxID=2995170 RepID=UPI00226D6D31|nr:PEP-CTERM sorting domain-containing protein [Luteolibacter sp. SL250]WAC21782.1 PEP-CTERM sorting domain-containing protein [Luteolibacter sp. SL250]